MAAPRPFYILGHNTNTIADVRTALAGGANAIEPDINVVASVIMSPSMGGVGGIPFGGIPVHPKHAGKLCISHGEGDDKAPLLDKFLQDLHAVQKEFPQLSLIVLDCKPKAATAAHGLEILTTVRKFLTFDNDLNVIVSIADRKDNQASIFDQIHAGLRPHEGLMIDEEDDPVEVSKFFTNLKVENQCYGYGISVANATLGPYYRYASEHACELCAESGQPKFNYAWTVNEAYDLREYIRIGVDGIITDDVPKLRNITKEAEFHPLIRMATRKDNPFQPANHAFGLVVHTGDVDHAGTDANVTFTVHGTHGSASKTVNTNLVKRMERNDWNYVTIPSDDLGSLTAITVQRDNSGNGPDWFLDRIRVRSAKFPVAKEAVFNRWIDNTSPVTVNLP